MVSTVVRSGLWSSLRSDLVCLHLVVVISWIWLRWDLNLDQSDQIQGFEPGPLIRSHISLDTAHDGIRTRNLRDQIRDLNLDQSPQIHGRVVELSD